jgi:hypothetical protein
MIYDSLSLINSTLLTGEMVLLYAKNLSLTDDPHSLLYRKMYNPLPVQCQLLPSDLLYTHFPNSLATVYNELIL